MSLIQPRQPNPSIYVLSSLLTTVPHKHLIIKRKFGQMALKVTGNRVAELLLPGPAIPIICTSSRSAWQLGSTEAGLVPSVHRQILTRRSELHSSAIVRANVQAI
jgi:hypothetical protein